MESRRLGKVPNLKRSVSSLTSRINTWSSSKPSSPVRKKAKSASSDAVSFKSALVSDLEREEANSTPWYQLYHPKSVNEVCIHKKKATEVREALEKMLKGGSSSRVLLLTGPSGCCKSTIAGELANELIPKYRRPRTVSLLSNSTGSDNIVEFENDSNAIGTTHMSEFQDFLSQAKYRVGPNLSLILVEDLPNIFHQGTRKAFQDQLLEWLYTSSKNLPPLVICLTECEIEDEKGGSNSFGVDYSFTAETILGKEVLSHPRLQRIKFNPINTTLMKKTLMNICVRNKATLESTNKWSEKERVVDSIARSTGDIRSGIMMLQFWASSTVDGPLLVRESFVSYFHAIGRILHGSKDFENDNEMINELISSSKGHLSHENFSLGILENYSSFNKGKFNVKDAFEVTNSLSQSNVLRSVPESLEFSMRKVRYTFGKSRSEERHHGKASFPREWRSILAQNEFRIKAEDYLNVSMYKYIEPRLLRDIALHFGFYDPLIRKARYYKQKSLLEYAAQAQSKNGPALPDIPVDPKIDILGRIGGEIDLLNSEEKGLSEDDHNLIARQTIDNLRRSRDVRLQVLKGLYEQLLGEILPQDGEEEPIDDDPIIESDEDACPSNILEDDDSLFDDLSQKLPKPYVNTSINESLSDSDLEHL